MSPKPPSRVELLQGTLDVLILRTLLPGPMHGHAIAKHIQRTSENLLQVETGSLYPALHRLEAKGWVERRAQAGDRRINRVYLTAEAERVHKRIWRIAEVTVDDALANFSAQEGAQLRKLLARVKQNLVVVVDGNGAMKNGAARSKPVPRHTRPANDQANGRHHGRAAP